MIANLLLHCFLLESVRAYIVSNLYHANYKTTVSPLLRTRHGALKADESVLQMISGRFGCSSLEAVDLIVSNAVKSPSSRGSNKARVQMQSTRGHKSNRITLFCASPSRGFEDNTVEQAVEEQSVSSEVSTFISETTDTDSKLLHHHDPHAEQQSLIKTHLDIKVDTLPQNIMATELKAGAGAATAARNVPVPHPMVITVMDSNAVPPPKKKKDSGFKAFFKGNWLVMGEVIVIYLAHLNPSFGATGGRLRPEFFISKLGVFTIFFINGIALSIEPSPDELQTASKTNSIIQLFNFAVIPLLAKALAPHYPEAAFRDGLLALSILPCTINICVAQTLSAGGNMGTAIFNAIFANVLGVFLTPLLAVWIMGAGKGISLVSTLSKLGGVVILPLIAGQICRQTPLRQVAEKSTKYTRTLSSLLLLAIVYNVFSDTFVSGIGVGGSALATLLVAMPVTYMALSGIFWLISKYLLPGLDPETRAAALFCSSQKTLAFGIPFIKTAFGHRPDLAYILAPLLIYAPAQLLLGSTVLVPAMKKKIKKARDFEDGGGI